MSRYDLEEALRTFIQENVSHDYCASDDHDHDYSAFEDKVTEYLGDRFNVGGGCHVQRAFEQSVRAIIVSFLDNDSHDDNLVRQMLQGILNKARSLPGNLALPALMDCSMALARIIENQSTTPEPVAVPSN
jgi:hypothetical protein